MDFSHCEPSRERWTAYVRDADGNNQGLSSTAVTYNNRNQVSNIDGLAQDYLDQGNDLRTSTAGTRVINGPLGVTAYKTGSQTVFLSRDPAGNLMTNRPTSGTSLYYFVEPNGNVAGATDLGDAQYGPSSSNGEKYPGSPKAQSDRATCYKKASCKFLG